MKNVTVFVALILIVMIISIPFIILKDSLENKPANQSIRLHWQTGNTTRLGKDNISQQINKLVFPQGSVDAVILVNEESYKAAISALGLQLPIFFVDDEITPEIEEEIQRLNPTGLTSFNNNQVILLGGKLEDIFDSIKNLGYRVGAFEGNAELIQYELAELINSEGGKNNIIIGHQEEIVYLLPVLSLAVHKGLPVLLLNDEVPADFRNYVNNNKDKRYFYLLGKEKILDLKDELNEYGQVKIINSQDIYQQSVRVARFYDPDNNFGWQANGNTAEGGHNTILVNPDINDSKISSVILAALLGLRGKYGPILYTNSNFLPAIIEKYYWQLKPDFWVTPTEGPYNHTWIIGNLNDINFPVQGRVDFLQEIQPYESLGEQGMSGLEMIGLIWLITTFTSAIWIFVHLFIRLPLVSYLMKLAWILLVLITGPLGIWIYYQAYKGYDTKVSVGEWPRPLWVQGLVATISSLSFGASIMIISQFFLLRNGWPQLFRRGDFFVIGNSMLQTMLISYLLALIINSTLFMPVMLRMGTRLNYIDAIKKSLLPVILSMTTVSLGMMGLMWWLQMEYLPMMPEESELLWIFTIQIATIVGLLVAYPININLVRRGLKKGKM